MQLLALYGPTAAGKTRLAVALRAAGLPVEAISCDALQVYRGLDAATAKPSEAERAALPHHLIDCAEPAEAMTAGRWAELAEAAARDIGARGGWPVLVGGTGLYLRALGKGLAEIPAVPEQLRAALTAEWAQSNGPERLYAELTEVDPAYAAKTPLQNRQRVLRALEVWRHTGRSFSSFHEAHQASPPRHTIQLAAVVAEPVQHLERLQHRAEAMAEPLWHEVAGLLASGLPATAPGLQALGYRDAVALQEQGLALAEALPALRRVLVAAHRAYVKKQHTWLRSEPVALRVDPDAPHSLDELVALANRIYRPA